MTDQIQYQKHDTAPATVDKVQWTGNNYDDIVDFLDSTYPTQQAGTFLQIFLRDNDPRAAELNGVDIIAQGQWLSK